MRYEKRQQHEGVEKRFQSGVSCANLTPGRATSPPSPLRPRRGEQRGEVKRNKAAVRHKAQVLLLAAILQRCCNDIARFGLPGVFFHTLNSTPKEHDLRTPTSRRAAPLETTDLLEASGLRISGDRVEAQPKSGLHENMLGRRPTFDPETA